MGEIAVMWKTGRGHDCSAPGTVLEMERGCRAASRVRRHGAPVVAMRGVRIDRGRRSVLVGIDLDINPGEVVGLVGPNGSGKTTLMKAMAGLISPASGEMRRTGRCGIQLEFPPFVEDATGRSNLLLLARLDGTCADRVDGAIREVGLDPGLATRVRGYSQGMRKRLGIAQAVMGDVSAVLLDEPMNGLDPAGMVALRDIVSEQAQAGRAVVISSHLLGELEGMCDSVYLVAKGGVAPLSWIREPGGLERAYLEACR